MLASCVPPVGSAAPGWCRCQGDDTDTDPCRGSWCIPCENLRTERKPRSAQGTGTSGSSNTRVPLTATAPTASPAAHAAAASGSPAKAPAPAKLGSLWVAIAVAAGPKTSCSWAGVAAMAVPGSNTTPPEKAPPAQEAGATAPSIPLMLPVATAPLTTHGPRTESVAQTGCGVSPRGWVNVSAPLSTQAPAKTPPAPVAAAGNAATGSSVAATSDAATVDAARVNQDIVDPSRKCPPRRATGTSDRAAGAPVRPAVGAAGHAAAGDRVAHGDQDPAAQAPQRDDVSLANRRRQLDPGPPAVVRSEDAGRPLRVAGGRVEPTVVAGHDAAQAGAARHRARFERRAAVDRASQPVRPPRHHQLGAVAQRGRQQLGNAHEVGDRANPVTAPQRAAEHGRALDVAGGRHRATDEELLRGDERGRERHRELPRRRSWRRRHGDGAQPAAIVPAPA